MTLTQPPRKQLRSTWLGGPDFLGDVRSSSARLICLLLPNLQTPKLEPYPSAGINRVPLASTATSVSQLLLLRVGKIGAAVFLPFACRPRSNCKTRRRKSPSLPAQLPEAQQALAITSIQRVRTKPCRPAQCLRRHRLCTDRRPIGRCNRSPTSRRRWGAYRCPLS